MKKLIITESQYKSLKISITETNHQVILDNIIKDLDKNYEKVTAVVGDYHDYYEKPRIKVKADDSVIKAKDLLEYLKYKHHGICGEEFLKQVIDDWYHDKVKDGMLSKNITLK